MKFKAFAIIPRKDEIEILPLVLCKECRYYYCGCTKGHDCPDGGNWFCADGEKKREGTRRYRCSSFGTISWEEDDDEED